MSELDSLNKLFVNKINAPFEWRKVTNCDDSRKGIASRSRCTTIIDDDDDDNVKNHIIYLENVVNRCSLTPLSSSSWFSWLIITHCNIENAPAK